MKKIDATQWDSEVLAADVAVVQFSAEWCGFCMMMRPILEQFESKHNVRVFSIDIMKNRDVADRYDVKSLPTIVFFANGKEAARIRGAVPLSILERTFADCI